jgi:ATP-binding cassette subfamily C protein CydC
MNTDILACVVLAVWAAFEAAGPLAGAFQHLGNLLESARRVNEIAGAEPTVAFPKTGATAPDRHDVRFSSVRFRYAQHLPPAVDGVDLHIPHGSRSAVVGETGSGKSTLGHLLARFWDPDEGVVTVGGTDIRQFSEAAVRRLWSVVPQQPHLFHTSLRENLCIGAREASEERLLEALDQIGLADFVRGLPEGLDTVVGEGGRRISGGQARRIAVARAILHDAPIWLLDEPTEGLDTVAERQLLDELLRITEGRTLVWITHRLVCMDRMDAIFVLDGGKAVERGTHGSLLAAGNRYAALHLRLESSRPVI